MHGDDCLEMLLLGTPRLQINGTDLTNQVGDKPLAVAAYLAVSAPARVPRSRLASTFWTEKSGEASRYRLRHALWELRKSLGKECIRTDDGSCWFDLEASASIDVHRFQEGCKRRLASPPSPDLGKELQRFRDLIDLYRGELLDGIIVREAPLFEEWLLVERERLELLYLDALWCLAASQFEAGDEDGAAASLKQLIEADPLRERGYRLLMELHLRKDDRNGALRVYKQCADVLSSELGVSPSRETQLLRQSIARGTSQTAETHLQRAIALSAKGRHREALSACTAAESRQPDPIVSSQITLLRAEIAANEGRQGESVRLIQMAREAIARLLPH